MFRSGSRSSLPWLRVRSLVALALPVLVAAATSLGATPAAAVHELPLRAWLRGGLTLVPVADGLVEIRADMRGLSLPFGPTDAQAAWTTSAERLELLRTGAIDELRIGSGVIAASVANGSTVGGVFSGTLRRLRSGDIAMDAEFTITGGTGIFRDAGGAGAMRGIADPATLAFSLAVRGALRR